MPAIIDTAPPDAGEAISIFESGAILLYLAEKTGKFLPNNLYFTRSQDSYLMVILASWRFKTNGGSKSLFQLQNN